MSPQPSIAPARTSSVVPLGLRSLGALLLAVVFAWPSFAQPYGTDKNFDPKVGRDNRIAVQRMVKDNGAFAQGQAQFNDFFTKFYFPAMTRPEPESLAELGKLRYELFSKFIWATPNPAMRTQLTELARVAMGQQILNPAYHPAVRYNAVLVMGLLDQEFDGKNSPTPLPQATKVLTYIVDNGVSGNKFPPTLVLGALVGLERHAQYRDKLEPATIPPLTTALLNLINTEKPIQQMDPEAYSWLRLRAASVLAQLGSAGPNGESHAALMKLLANDKSLDNRAAVAGTLGKITYKDAKIDGKATVDSMLKLAGELAAAELKRAKDFDSAGMGGGFTGPEFSSFSSGPQKFPRQQVLARLLGLRQGIRAVKSALDEEQQTKLTEIDSALDPVIKGASNKDVGDLALTGSIRTMADKVARLVAKAAEADAEAPADGEPAAVEAASAPVGEAPPESAPAEAPAEEAPAEEAPPAEAPSAEEPAAEDPAADAAP